MEIGSMKRLSAQIGFWSALVCALAFVAFAVCFVIVIATSPLFFWSGLADYVAYVQENGQFWPNLARLCMLVFGPAFVILLGAIHEYSGEGKKILTRISLSFGILFAATTGIHYFVQLTAVRLSIQQGQTIGLEQIVQGNPLSAVSAVNMLGVTLFLGLASLFLFPVFDGGRTERVIRYSFMFNGIFCLLGFVSYILQINLLLFLTINLGMGAAVTVATIALTILFRGMLGEPAQAAT
jgi:hypothetical protein